MKEYIFDTCIECKKVKKKGWYTINGFYCDKCLDKVDPYDRMLIYKKTYFSVIGIRDIEDEKK